MSEVKTLCQGCQKWFLAWRKGVSYCSSSCRNRHVYYHAPPTFLEGRVCQGHECDKVLADGPSGRRQDKFCSVSCSRRWQVRNGNTSPKGGRQEPPCTPETARKLIQLLNDDSGARARLGRMIQEHRARS